MPRRKMPRQSNASTALAEFSSEDAVTAAALSIQNATSALVAAKDSSGANTTEIEIPASTPAVSAPVEKKKSKTKTSRTSKTSETMAPSESVPAAVTVDEQEPEKSFSTTELLPQTEEKKAQQIEEDLRELRRKLSGMPSQETLPVVRSASGDIKFAAFVMAVFIAVMAGLFALIHQRHKDASNDVQATAELPSEQDKPASQTPPRTTAAAAQTPVPTPVVKAPAITESGTAKHPNMLAPAAGVAVPVVPVESTPISVDPSVGRAPVIPASPTNSSEKQGTPPVTSPPVSASAASPQELMAIIGKE